MTSRTVRPLLLALAGAAVLALPAAASAQQAATPHDPLETLNRKTYALNRVIDRFILRPLALGYENHTPRPFQRAVHNVVTELSEPLVFVNDVLQLRPKRAGKTVARFVVNATVGVAGLFDQAGRIGLEHHDNGFGTTLGRYGVKPGPYVIIPVLGPSDFRDMIGAGVDAYSDPLRLLKYKHGSLVTAAVVVLGGLDQRARAETDLVEVEQMGTDPYATMRSLYLQNRAGEVRGGAPIRLEDLPDFDTGPEPAPAAEAPAEAAPAAPEAAPTPPPPQSP